MDKLYTLADQLLLEYADVLGADFIKYRNHVHRVLAHCLLLDPYNEDNYEKYAIAAVLHDIGIWTDHTIDYLAPSIRSAEVYLSRSGYQKYEAEIKAMILWHHKITIYKGNYTHSVEVFRKADCIDVSLGMLTLGLKSREINQVKKAYPYKGFHRFLLKSIIRNLFRHPRNPLPMFRW